MRFGLRLRIGKPIFSAFLCTFSRQLSTALSELVTTIISNTKHLLKYIWLMMQLFLCICWETQVWMLIIVLDVAVKFQGKEWDQIPLQTELYVPETQTLCYLRRCIPVFGKHYLWAVFLVKPGLQKLAQNISPCIFGTVMKMYLSNTEVCGYFQLKILNITFQPANLFW